MTKGKTCYFRRQDAYSVTEIQSSLRRTQRQNKNQGLLIQSLGLSDSLHQYTRQASDPDGHLAESSPVDDDIAWGWEQHGDGSFPLTENAYVRYRSDGFDLLNPRMLSNRRFVDL